MSQLIISCNNQIVRRVKLTKACYIIGRSHTCDIVLQERTISNQHAKIINAGEDCFLEDSNSTNGVLVNCYLVQRHLLIDDDIIQIGKYQLTFRSTADLTTQLKQLSIQPHLVRNPKAPCLEITSGDKQGNLIILERNKITLSDHDNDKITIERNADGAYLLHKTTVQGTPKTTQMSDQDSLRVGDVDLVFHTLSQKENEAVIA